MKPWVEKNDMKMCSIQNEGKPVVAERYIRTLKNKIYNYITSMPNNVYIDKHVYCDNVYICIYK